MFHKKADQENGGFVPVDHHLNIQGITLAFQKLVDGRFDQVRFFFFGKIGIATMEFWLKTEVERGVPLCSMGIAAQKDDPRVRALVRSLTWSQ